jgi:photosystem II stability/assembly factor-like uncharacterized protein
MKNLNKIKILVLFATVFCSCGKKNTSLLDRLPVETAVNPETKVLLKDNALLHVQLENGNVIKGITRKNLFETKDLFKNFSVASYTLPPATMKTEFDKNYVVSLSDIRSPTTITYSTDYGNSWQSVTTSFNNPLPFYTDIVTVKFVNNTTLLLLGGAVTYSCAQQNCAEGNSFLYKINLQTGKADSLSGIKGYYPMSLQFINTTTGWMLLNKIVALAGGNNSNENTYISKTTDGGANWSIPLLVDASARLNLAAGTSTMFLYKTRDHGYFSTDGGATWKQPKKNEYFHDVVVLNDKLLYAVAEIGFMKSTDSGNSWMAVSEYSYGKLHFLNEKQGIRYNTESLYITNDGGLTWQVLLYRFPYIIQ